MTLYSELNCVRNVLDKFEDRHKCLELLRLRDPKGDERISFFPKRPTALIILTLNPLPGLLPLKRRTGQSKVTAGGGGGGEGG